MNEDTLNKLYSFDAIPDLDALAKAQGAQPIEDIDELVADFWPEDESIDDFIAACKGWRREEAGVGKREVLDVKQAAEFLGFSAYTVREKARNGEIPGRKIGGEWRFSRRQLLEWLENTGKGATL